MTDSNSSFLVRAACHTLLGMSLAITSTATLAANGCVPADFLERPILEGTELASGTPKPASGLRADYVAELGGASLRLHLDVNQRAIERSYAEPGTASLKHRYSLNCVDDRSFSGNGIRAKLTEEGLVVEEQRIQDSGIPQAMGILYQPSPESE
ncbi:hypothetical protein ACKC9G_16650 [Pokkaliibacter sp. CJK22405]|uniref:hypothetical protein n=1 Tax=Pokkaliibacter sp. CJK22405 TaxID=3384615 RepID=UPI003985138D